MESKTHPPRIDPIYDAGTPDESGAYPKHVDPDKTPVDAPVIPRRDVVEHPPHYEAGPCEAHEARAWVHDRLAAHDPELARALYEALKYAWRCGGKDGADPREDCRKARWYLAQISPTRSE